MDLQNHLVQLEQAKALVSQDAQYYSAIVSGVLPLAQKPEIELKRWIADFLRQTFTDSRLGSDERERIAISCLDTIHLLIMEDDPELLKLLIQCSALIYQYIFRFTCFNTASGKDVWATMSKVKSRILRVWDEVTKGVHISSIKFAQKVILCQTPGIKDPRLADRSDISLTIVPLSHPIIPHGALEAEAQGLLDRMLSVFQEPIPNPIIIEATVNACPLLVKTRATVAAKIISAVLSFNTENVVKDISDPVLAKLRFRSVDKSIKIFLRNIIISINNLAPRIQQYLEGKLAQSRLQLDESRKRGASEVNDGISKRSKRESSQQPPATITSLIELYTFADSQGPATLFDVSALPIDLVVPIILSVFESIDPGVLSNRLGDLNARYVKYPNVFASDTMDAQIGLEPQGEAAEPAFTPFVLPEPEDFNPLHTSQVAQEAIDRIFFALRDFEKSGLEPVKPVRVDQVAAAVATKDVWITILSRITTRGMLGHVKSESSNTTQNPISDILREKILAYVLSSFRERLDVMIKWLTEEWYHDKLNGSRNYYVWSLKVLDGIFPFLDAGKEGQRYLMRILSDLPELTIEMIMKLRTLLLDPSRCRLASTAMQYVILFRPPNRKMSLDLAEEMYTSCMLIQDGAHFVDPETRTSLEKMLKRWRSDVIKRFQKEVHSSTPAVEPVA